MKQVVCVKSSKLPLHHRLANFLLSYRTTPHTVTGRTPAELFLKRNIRTHFTMLKPDLSKVVEKKQEEQKHHHDNKRVKYREFQSKDKVMVRNFRGGKDDKWIPGVVVRRKGPVNYLVRVGAKIRFVHIDHLLEASMCEQSNTSQESVEKLLSGVPPIMPTVSSEVVVEKPTVNSPVPDVQVPTSAPKVDSPRVIKSNVTPMRNRYPQRERRPAKRLITEF